MGLVNCAGGKDVPVETIDDEIPATQPDADSPNEKQDARQRESLEDWPGNPL